MQGCGTFKFHMLKPTIKFVAPWRRPYFVAETCRSSE